MFFFCSSSCHSLLALSSVLALRSCSVAFLLAYMFCFIYNTCVLCCILVCICLLASLCLFFLQVILALFRFLNLCSSPCFVYVLLDLFCFSSLYVFLALYFRLCSCSSWSCFVMWVLCFGTWFWWEMTKLIIIIKYDCPFNCVFFYFRVFMYLFRTDVYFVHCFFCLKEVLVNVVYIF